MRTWLMIVLAVLALGCDSDSESESPDPSADCEKGVRGLFLTFGNRHLPKSLTTDEKILRIYRLISLSDSEIDILFSL